MDSTTNYLQKNKARLVPFAILAFLALATFFTLTLTRQRQDLQQRAAADNGKLTFANGSAQNVNPGGVFEVNVNMNGSNQVVIGADVLVDFDETKLTLTGITKNNQNTNPFKTYAPVDANGAFDTQRVINCANSGGANCPGGAGRVEFGIVSFDWSGNALTSPNATNSNLSPVTKLTFQVKNNAASGQTQLSFVNNGINSTTDSNIVVNPASGNPEDILQAPGYNNSTIAFTIGGTGSPQPTPSTNPSPSPSSPPPSGGACTPASQNDCRDLNGDGVLNILEITQMINRYDSTPSSVNYSFKQDYNCDSTINILDITQVINRYDQSSCARL